MAITRASVDFTCDTCGKELRLECEAKPDQATDPHETVATGLAGFRWKNEPELGIDVGVADGALLCPPCMEVPFEKVEAALSDLLAKEAGNPSSAA